MAKGIKGNVIKAKRIADVQTVLNQCKHPAAAAKYNHFRTFVYQNSYSILSFRYEI